MNKHKDGHSVQESLRKRPSVSQDIDRYVTLDRLQSKTMNKEYKIVFANTRFHLQDCLYWCMQNTLYHTVPVYTTVFLKMNPRVRNM